MAYGTLILKARMNVGLWNTTILKARACHHSRSKNNQGGPRKKPSNASGHSERYWWPSEHDTHAPQATAEHENTVDRRSTALKTYLKPVIEILKGLQRLKPQQNTNILFTRMRLRPR